MTPSSISKKSTTPHPTPTLSGSVPLSLASFETSSQLGSSPDHFPSSMHFLRNGPTRWNCGRQWYSMELPKRVDPFDVMIRPLSIVPGALQSIAIKQCFVINMSDNQVNYPVQIKEVLVLCASRRTK